MISNVSSSNSASGSVASGSSTRSNASQVFTLELDSEMLGQLEDILGKAGKASSPLSGAVAAARQQAAAAPDWRQLFAPSHTHASESTAVQAQSAAAEASPGVQCGLTPDYAAAETSSGRVKLPEVSGSAAGFAPEFLQVQGIDPDGTQHEMNSVQFASRETADALAKALGAKGVTEVKLEGLYRWTAPQYMLDFGSVQLNAGLVADLYRKYPKTLADAFVGRDIAMSQGIGASDPLGSHSVSSVFES